MVRAHEIYSPDPNFLEVKVADRLAQYGAEGYGADYASRGRMEKIGRITKWVIALAALAGIVSGGLIGGAEVYVRQVLLDGEDVDWRESLPYWTVFFVFAGAVSAVEVALLYVLALFGIARVTEHSGLPLSRENERGLFTHSLARAALEFPNPQVSIYGLDPYARVSNWKLTALNFAYKLKVGVTSFILRVFLRRVAARMAIRGMVPLFAGPLYAAWNAYIVWRIMSEARLRTMGPFAVDTLIEARFEDSDDLDDTEKDVLLHAAGEMLTRGRDAHPNQVYLISRLRQTLGHEGDIKLDWGTMHSHLPKLDSDGQTRVLDLLTLSSVIGASIHREQLALLHSACEACGTDLRSRRRGVPPVRRYARPVRRSTACGSACRPDRPCPRPRRRR
jgi:hypothetical protein